MVSTYIIRYVMQVVICAAHQHKRKNKELHQLAPRSFTINREQYVKYQFADPFIAHAGKKIAKPATW